MQLVDKFHLPKIPCSILPFAPGGWPINPMTPGFPLVSPKREPLGRPEGGSGPDGPEETRGRARHYSPVPSLGSHLGLVMSLTEHHFSQGNWLQTPFWFPIAFSSLILQASARPGLLHCPTWVPSTLPRPMPLVPLHINYPQITLIWVCYLISITMLSDRWILAQL